MYRRGRNLPQHANALLGMLNQQARGLQRYAIVLSFNPSFVASRLLMYRVTGVALIVKSITHTSYVLLNMRQTQSGESALSYLCSVER